MEWYLVKRRDNFTLPKRRMRKGKKNWFTAAITSFFYCISPQRSDLHGWKAFTISSRINSSGHYPQMRVLTVPMWVANSETCSMKPLLPDTHLVLT